MIEPAALARYVTLYDRTSFKSISTPSATGPPRELWMPWNRT